MQVKVDFTLSIDPERLAGLRELFQVDTNSDLAIAIRGEAADYVMAYMQDNIEDAHIGPVVRNMEQVHRQVANPGMSRRRTSS